MSTYLATVALGPLRRAPLLDDLDRPGGRSRSGRSWTRRAAHRPGADALLPKVIRFEEKRFGAYPFASAGMIVDDADVGYALETQTRPFYPGGLDTPTLVHETAHQWYGDSVTLTDWHDIWLAEGFATYAEWLWDGAHGGRTPAQHFDASTQAGRRRPVAPRPDRVHRLRGPVRRPGVQPRRDDPAGAARAGRRSRLRADPARPGPPRTGTATCGPRSSWRSPSGSPASDLDTLFRDWLQLDGKPAGY